MRTFKLHYEGGKPVETDNLDIPDDEIVQKPTSGSSNTGLVEVVEHAEACSSVTSGGACDCCEADPNSVEMLDAGYVWRKGRWREPRGPKLWSVAVFMVDRAYGGPEEGGWYYDTGSPADEFCQFTRLFHTEDAAWAYRTRLDNQLCRALNKGRRSISSVLSEGEYRAVCAAGLPLPFPVRRPRYE